MGAWVIRPDRLGDPQDAMQLEQIEIPELGPGEVLVLVMAAGVNFNGVWAAQGKPVSVFRCTGYVPHRRLATRRASSWKVGKDVAALEAGRRGRHPLQPELRPVPRVQRPRSDGLLGAEDLGLRDVLGHLRAVHARCRRSSWCQSPKQLTWEEAASLRAHLLHRLSHAGRPRRRSSRATTCWSGARPAASASSPCSCARCWAPTRSRSCRRATRSSSCVSSAPTAIIDRRDFAFAEPDDRRARSIDEVKRFGGGTRRSPAARIPTSSSSTSAQRRSAPACSSCKRFGKIVICGATSGFDLDFDVRYLWMRQK